MPVDLPIRIGHVIPENQQGILSGRKVRNPIDLLEVIARACQCAAEGSKGEIIVLDAADSSFVLEGSDKAPEMVGKKVTVTGTIAEKDTVKVINVLSMEEVTE